LLILLLSASFYFWEFSFYPIINIIIKSTVVATIYGFVVYYFRLSEDITVILNKILKR